MPRTLTTAHSDLIASGHCGETTTLDLILPEGSAKTFTADVSTNTFTSAAHGLINGDTVVVMNDDGLKLPKPLQHDTVYYVVSATTNTFQLSHTSGGAAIDVTWAGLGTNKVLAVAYAHLATGQETVSGVAYAAQLHPDEGLKLSLWQSVDRAQLDVQNVDKVLGLSITDRNNNLDGARAITGIVHKDLDNDVAYYDSRLVGEVRTAEVIEASSSVSLDIASDIDSGEYAGDLVLDAFPFTEPPIPRNYGDIDDLLPVGSGGGGRGVEVADVCGRFGVENPRFYLLRLTRHARTCRKPSQCFSSRQGGDALHLQPAGRVERGGLPELDALHGRGPDGTL